MSTLTSSSTIAEIEAAYVDNASYVEDKDVAKCRAFITAARILLIKLPVSQAKAGASLTYSIDSVRDALKEAQKWLEDHSTDDDDRAGPRVTRVDFRNFRT